MAIGLVGDAWSRALDPLGEQGPGLLDLAQLVQPFGHLADPEEPRPASGLARAWTAARSSRATWRPRCRRGAHRSPRSRPRRSGRGPRSPRRPRPPPRGRSPAIATAIAARTRNSHDLVGEPRPIRPSRGPPRDRPPRGPPASGIGAHLPLRAMTFHTGSISRRAIARDSSSGIGSGSIGIARAGRSAVRVSATVTSPSPRGSSARGTGSHPRARSRNTGPAGSRSRVNRPSGSLRVEVGSGPSPVWKTSTPATGSPCRSTTRPPIAATTAAASGAGPGDARRSSIQSERIGSLPGPRTATR